MPSLKNPICIDGKEEESLRQKKSGKVQLNAQPRGVKREKGAGSEGGYSHLPLNFHTSPVMVGGAILDGLILPRDLTQCQSMQMRMHMYIFV